MGASPLVRQLLDAGVHFGHQTKRWNPKMKQFIFGARSGIYIIDLEKTEAHLQRAREFVESVAAKGEAIVFVGTKKQARPIIRAEAKRCGMPYVADRWLGGSLTNFQMIRRNIQNLIQLRQQHAEGYFERLSKKDAKRLRQQMGKLEINFGGLSSMERLPSCLFVVDPKREFNAVHEANRLNIPVIAICDTNADPDLIAYPIPGNDDAIRSIQMIASFVTESILAGRQQAGIPIAPMAPAVESSEAIVAAQPEPA